MTGPAFIFDARYGVTTVDNLVASGPVTKPAASAEQGNSPVVNPPPAKVALSAFQTGGALLHSVRRLAPTACESRFPFYQKLDVAIPELGYKVPVWVADDLKMPRSKIEQLIRDGVQEFIKKFSAEAAHVVFLGDPEGKQDSHPAKIILLSGKKGEIERVVARCEGYDHAGQPGGFYFAGSNTIYINHVTKKICERFENNDEVCQIIEPSDIMSTLAHEMFHGLHHWKLSYMPALEDRYLMLRDLAFSPPGGGFDAEKFERFLTLESIEALGGTLTEAESEEYFTILEENVHPYFSSGHAATNFHEYFAEYGESYYVDPDAFKIHHPVEYALLRPFFESGAHDPTSLASWEVVRQNLKAAILQATADGQYQNAGQLYAYAAHIDAGFAERLFSEDNSVNPRLVISWANVAKNPLILENYDHLIRGYLQRGEASKAFEVFYAAKHQDDDYFPTDYAPLVTFADQQIASGALTTWLEPSRLKEDPRFFFRLAAQELARGEYDSGLKLAYVGLRGVPNYHEASFVDGIKVVSVETAGEAGKSLLKYFKAMALILAHQPEAGLVLLHEALAEDPNLRDRARIDLFYDAFVNIEPAALRQFMLEDIVTAGEVSDPQSIAAIREFIAKQDILDLNYDSLGRFLQARGLKLATQSALATHILWKTFGSKQRGRPPEGSAIEI